jgi:hypothetical protein
MTVRVRRRTTGPGPDIAEFDGQRYIHEEHFDILTGQMRDIYDFLSDHRPHTVAAIADALGFAENSTGADTRSLRKDKFGRFCVPGYYGRKWQEVIIEGGYRERWPKQTPDRLYLHLDPYLYYYQLLGVKGDGEPSHRQCTNCPALEEAVEELEDENRRLCARVERLRERLRTR